MDIIPVGTIVAYGGPLNEADKANLKALGWLPCDGSLLKKKDYAELALTISPRYGEIGGSKGSFNVPDFRGRFLRGVTHGSQNDPDISIRTASNAGGNTGNLVGSLQSFATGKPARPFTTTGSGDHSHNVPHAPVGNSQYLMGGSIYSEWNDNNIPIREAGEHAHIITSGFDPESRPINRYVNYIIKYKGQD
jgi:hypothetical protein